MSGVSLILIYESDGTPIPLARITDQDLVVDAAATAIVEAERRAELEGDQDLRIIDVAEARRVRDILRHLIPAVRQFDLESSPAVQ